MEKSKPYEKLIARATDFGLEGLAEEIRQETKKESDLVKIKTLCDSLGVNPIFILSDRYKGLQVMDKTFRNTKQSLRVIGYLESLINVFEENLSLYYQTYPDRHIIDKYNTNTERIVGFFREVFLKGHSNGKFYMGLHHYMSLLGYKLIVLKPEVARKVFLTESYVLRIKSSRFTYFVIEEGRYTDLLKEIAFSHGKEEGYVSSEQEEVFKALKGEFGEFVSYLLGQIKLSIEEDSLREYSLNSFFKKHKNLLYTLEKPDLFYEEAKRYLMWIEEEGGLVLYLFLAVLFMTSTWLLAKNALFLIKALL